MITSGRSSPRQWCCVQPGNRAPPPESGAGKDTLSLAAPRILDALTYALEFTNHDGPFDLEQDFQRYNAFLRYHAVRGEHSFTITAQANYSRTDSPDQIAQRAIEEGLITRFGSLDQTVGLNTQRYSVDAEWRH